MEPTTNGNISKEWLSGLYERNAVRIGQNDPPAVKAMRAGALNSFVELGFPSRSLESWRHTDLKETLERDYDYTFTPPGDLDAAAVVHCNIPHLDTAVIGQMNGWYVSKEVPLIELGNGIILGSLAEAFVKYPQLVERYYGKQASVEKDAFNALNTAFAQDGIFIYVPDDVQSHKPVQMINVIRSDRNIFLQSRNLIILGKNSKLSVVHCDDSYNHQPSFSNVVTEIFLGDGATMDHYKLQNLNNQSSLISSVYFTLGRQATLDSHFLSLNGGLLRNNIHLLFDGEDAAANINGLYLMDRKQHVDNQVIVDHAKPGCTSNEQFKGILDEHASGVFNGHVLVRRNAQKTDARQSNRNILLTDTAKVNSKPFLEIYADDVKCSHGSTTGQLDAEAMFYLMQRGIGEEAARMLLMFAFAEEIVGKIAIPQLRQRIEDMVKKRLQGELQICDQCVLHCSTPEHPVDFVIDVSKI